jgi:plasmid stabilization system protein ParE
MTPRFVFQPEARDELREARDWYEMQQAGLGQDLGAIVAVTLTRISEHPEMYPEVDPGIRRAVLQRFPYSIFYRIRPSAIEVLAVFHHRRDPADWRSRAAV